MRQQEPEFDLVEHLDDFLGDALELSPEEYHEKRSRMGAAMDALDTSLIELLDSYSYAVIVQRLLMLYPEHRTYAENEENRRELIQRRISAYQAREERRDWENLRNNPFPLPKGKRPPGVPF